jgi:hypothetical protein
MAIRIIAPPVVGLMRLRWARHIHASSSLKMPIEGRPFHYDVMLTDARQALLGVQYLSIAPQVGTWPAKDKPYGK